MKTIRELIHHLFVPGPGNNFRARIVRVDMLSMYLVFVLALTFSLKAVAGFTNVLGFATDISVEKLNAFTNEKREQYHLRPLSYNNELAKAASEKAKDMFAKNYWSHFGPNGESPWQFILDNGYRYEFAGENLAKNFLFSQGVVDAWMNSQTHRDNILKSEYADVGYAVVNGVLNGEETTLVVQLFGKPLSASAEQTQNNPIIPPVEAKAEQTSGAAVQGTDTKKYAVNLLPSAFNFQLFFFALICLAFGIDLFFAARMNIVRLAGKNIAHMVFLGFIIVGLFIIARGRII